VRNTSQSMRGSARLGAPGSARYDGRTNGDSLTMVILQGYGTSTLPLTLDVTPEMMKTLEQIARDSKQPLEAVFTRAIALYQAALKATAAGKHVGYASSPDSLEVEFTGLASPGGQ
jgi:hypothetical protein